MSDVFLYKSNLTRAVREKKFQHKGKVFWFFGLSGSGKSTLVHALEEKIFNEKFQSVIVLDGDAVRSGLNSDLTFSESDRRENIRRSANLAKIMVENGFLVLCSFITPENAQRKMIKDILGDDVSLVFVDTPFEICQQRDPKGLYVQANAGQIANFTGIGSSFEVPNEFDLKITPEKSLEQNLENLFGEIISKVCN